MESPQTLDVVETVDNIPSLDQCWLQCIAVLRSFADGSLQKDEEVAEFAVDRLQRCILRQGDGIPSGAALLKCFDSVMLGLLIHFGRTDREKSYIVGVFVSTLLASSETLTKQPGFSSYWLRVIDVLCKYATQGGSLSETTVERMKNMLLVMRWGKESEVMRSVEGRFDVMSSVAGQNMLEATMTMLDSYCPSIRKDLEGIYQPREETNESSVSGEVMAEMAPIEDAAVVVVGGEEETVKDEGETVDVKGGVDEENLENGMEETKENGVEETKENGVEETKEDGVEENKEDGMEENKENGVDEKNEENKESVATEDNESKDNEETIQVKEDANPELTYEEAPMNNATNNPPEIESPRNPVE